MAIIILTAMLFLLHLRQVWFAKLLIEWCWVDWVFLEQGAFKGVRGENTEPTDGTRSEKVGTAVVKAASFTINDV